MYVNAGGDLVPVHGIVLLDPATGQPASNPLDVLPWFWSRCAEHGRRLRLTNKYELEGCSTICYADG